MSDTGLWTPIFKPWNLAFWVMLSWLFGARSDETWHDPPLPSLSSSTLPLSLPPSSPSLSFFFVLPPCPSRNHQWTFGETFQTCLFALLSSSVAKNPNHRAPTRCFTVALQSKVTFRDSRWSWLSAFFLHIPRPQRDVIYQAGCAPPLGNVMVLTMLWWLSCLSLVFWGNGNSSSTINQSKEWLNFTHPYIYLKQDVFKRLTWISWYGWSEVNCPKIAPISDFWILFFFFLPNWASSTTETL